MDFKGGVCRVTTSHVAVSEGMNSNVFMIFKTPNHYQVVARLVGVSQTVVAR